MSLFAVPQEVLDARPQPAKDFDFLQGRWLIHHKKLAERLVGCDIWDEFETAAFRSWWGISLGQNKSRGSDLAAIVFC
jgi:hypothetical protein